MCETREEFKFPFQVIDRMIQRQIEVNEMLGYAPKQILMEKSCYEHYCNNKLSWALKDHLVDSGLKPSDLTIKTWDGIEISVINDIRSMNNFGNYGLPIQISSKLAETTNGGLIDENRVSNQRLI